MSATSTPDFSPFAERMRREGLPEIVIDNFRHYFRALAAGNTGMISEAEIEPVTALPRADDLDEYVAAGKAALPHAAILKLNGGLGTSMGLQAAKSLLVAREGLSFLDIIARQTLASRRRYATNTPLILMNSFNTDADTREVIARYPDLAGAVPQFMQQHKVPKVLQNSLTPAEWPADADLEWCPPGHGDVYVALVTSSLLDTLLEHNYRYLFISNSDNLGATLDLGILGYIAQQDVPFLMEVARRTEADRKGGHLARLHNGRLVLREVAQCPDADLDAFQNVERHGYFNTNNIWVDLRRLKAVMGEQDNVLGLPMIMNKKTVDPRDSSSPAVYQLETAMGAAIQVFEGAQALHVSRSRFAPVKTCADLLVLRSDRYKLDEDYMLQANPTSSGDLTVDLDSRYYKLIDAFEQRFPEPVPALAGCTALKVKGDVRFTSGAVFRGAVSIVNAGTEQRVLPAQTVDDTTVEL